MNALIINILAGGPNDHLPDLSEYQTKEDVWAGVDRGALTLISEGITPNLALGDFDSVTTKEAELIEKRSKEIMKYSAEKDETDMELAIQWALKQTPERIRIFGATGGRLDHFFGNIQLLIHSLLSEHDTPIEIMDKNNLIFLKRPGHHPISKHEAYKYISFIPVSMEIHGLSLKGFKYPLENFYLQAGSTQCISNELINDNGNFSFSKGILMVVRSND